MNNAKYAIRSRRERTVHSGIRNEKDELKKVVDFLVETTPTSKNGTKERHFVPFSLLAELQDDIKVRTLSVITEAGNVEIGKITGYGKIVLSNKSQKFTKKVWRFAIVAAKIMAGIKNPEEDKSFSAKPRGNEICEKVFADNIENSANLDSMKLMKVLGF